MLLRPPGHARQDDDGASAVSDGSNTFVPQSEVDECYLPNYQDNARAGFATPTQGRVSTPAPPVPRTSTIKREESDTDILTDAFGQHRISPGRASPPSMNNGAVFDGQRQQNGSSHLLFSSPNPMSPRPAIGDGYLPASLNRNSHGSTGSSHSPGGSSNQGRPVNLREFPPPPSPDRSEGTNTC